MRRHAGRQPKRLPRDLSDAEVERFLAVVQDPRDLAMIAVMLYAGLRVGEVEGLRPADISAPAEPTVSVRLRVMGKGRKERVVYLCREGYQLLQAYLQAHPDRDPQQPLFRNRWGQPITVNGIQARIRQYAQASGVPVTCHRLRHTYGRWMAEGEVPVLALARLMGHANIQTTQRYIDGADPQLRRSYEAALQHAVTPVEDGETEPSPQADAIAPPLESALAPPRVQRAVPAAFDGSDWMPDWPAWLRAGCLDWVRHHWSGWKASRRQHLARVRLGELRRFWAWQLERRSFTGWDELTGGDITAFVDAELARGLVATTVKAQLGTVYGVLRFLAERGRLAAVPPRPSLSLPEPLPRHLSPTEVLKLETHVTQLEQTARPEDELDIALYCLLLYAGLRISEALDLQAQDLHLPARRVQVRAGKGQRDRVVYLTQQAADRIGHYLETVPHAPQDLVLSWRGRPLGDQVARQRLRRLAEAAGVEDVTPHRLRHTYATLLLNNGMDLDGLRQLMGHENLNTTLIYARLADRTIEQQYQTAMNRVTDATSVNSM